MAKMNGCNTGFMDMKGAQGKMRVVPAQWARNNLSKGGVNDHAGGTDKPAKKPPLSAGSMGQGKHRHDKR